VWVKEKMDIKTIGVVKVAVIVPRFNSHTAEEVETALTALIEKGAKKLGTSVILSELLKQGQYPGVMLINVDISERQLEKGEDSRILSLHVSVDKITRELLDPGNRPLLFVMRSVLHYFGHNGLRPFLAYPRSQRETGEFFVHQSICFEQECDAERVNLRYQRMRVNKWFPTVNELSTYLRDEGWTVDRISSVPKILATSQDLAERYQLGKKEIFRIRDEISLLYGKAPGVFVVTTDGFNANLAYKIFTCSVS
jgi:hypothetical protein